MSFQSMRHLAYQSSEAYTTPKGIEIAARVLKQHPCTNTCQFKCADNFPDDLRSGIKNECYALMNAVLKWSFISSLVEEKSAEPTWLDKCAKGVQSKWTMYCKEVFL